MKKTRSYKGNHESNDGASTQWRRSEAKKEDWAIDWQDSRDIEPSLQHSFSSEGRAEELTPRSLRAASLAKNLCTFSATSQYGPWPTAMR